MIGGPLAHVQHDNAYERGLRDAAFLDAVRGAYVGHWDVLDALWWQSHPLDPAPSGTPSPSARLRDLQHQAFSAGGNAIGDHAAAQRMRELEAEIIGEREAIIAALTAAQSHSRTAATTSPAMAHPMVSLSETTIDSPGGASAAPVPVLVPAGRRPRLVLVVGIAVALAIGGVAGTQLTSGTADAALPRSAPPSAAPSPEPLVEALTIFNKAQVPDDSPTVPIPDTFDLASFRSLGIHSDGSAAEAGVGLYAAKTTSNLICLVALAAQFDHLATCTLAGDFPATGLRLYWEADFAFQSDDGSTSIRPMDRYVVWQPDGSLDGGGAMRVSAAP